MPHSWHYCYVWEQAGRRLHWYMAGVQCYTPIR
jgi:hypothetical protein